MHLIPVPEPHKHPRRFIVPGSIGAVLRRLERHGSSDAWNFSSESEDWS